MWLVQLKLLVLDNGPIQFFMSKSFRKREKERKKNRKAHKIYIKNGYVVFRRHSKLIADTYTTGFFILYAYVDVIDFTPYYGCVIQEKNKIRRGSYKQQTIADAFTSALNKIKVLSLLDPH